MADFSIASSSVRYLIGIMRCVQRYEDNQYLSKLHENFEAEKESIQRTRNLEIVDSQPSERHGPLDTTPHLVRVVY